ncbi:MAG: PLDc N-terminal domain-containing protein [Nanoarchaeota archaeon]|nr:PLDc N-terminal domain-containing protein [Nanoarchaeota archaeon]
MDLLLSIGIFFLVISVFAILGFAIFLLILWLAMIIDCVQKNFKKDIDKVVWILLLIFIPVLAAVFYYFIVFRKGLNKKKKKK